MSIPIIMANRATKLAGNLIKGLGYIFHFVFPNKRFTIPEQSPALLKKEANHLIPKILWQTNYSNVVSLPMYINYLFNRLMSRDYTYRYASDEAILIFFKEYATSEELEAYQELNDGAAKADFWRVAVLYHLGGVYLDIDATFVWPLSKQIKPNEKEIFLLNKEHYTNYFMATAPKNPIYKEAIDIIVRNIRAKETAGGAYALTGPNVINLAIGEKKVTERFYRYVCTQGAFTNEHFHYIDKKQGKWTHTAASDLFKR